MISPQPMTLYELLSLVISIAGFVIVIITLVLLIRQTRDMTTQTKYVTDSLTSSAYGVIASQVFETNRIFIDNPDLRPFFYSGSDIGEDDPVYNKVLAVAEYILDYFESALLQMRHFPQVWPRPVWEAYITDSFTNSPVLCKYLRSARGWYVDELVALMQTGESRQQQANAQGDQI